MQEVSNSFLHYRNPLLYFAKAVLLGTGTWKQPLSTELNIKKYLSKEKTKILPRCVLYIYAKSIVNFLRRCLLSFHGFLHYMHFPKISLKYLLWQYFSISFIKNP